MRVVRWFGGSIAIAIAVLGTSALAAPSAEASRTVAMFSLPGSNGYSVDFGVTSGGRAVASAFRIDSSDTFFGATYETTGRVFGDRIRVRFGNLGRVTTFFHPSGRVKRRNPPRRCEGEPRLTSFGTFVGTVGFSGERGYTAAEASRARGRLLTLPRWRCKRGRARVPLGLNPTAEQKIELEATAARTRSSFSVSATRPPEERGSTFFTASRIERRGGLLISRFAFTGGPERTFVVDDALGTATAEPPPPFSGSAAFVRNPDGSTSWSGSLAVDLPGAEDVPLADSTFTARLYRP